jgi:phosphoribosylformimino-5-aminoimidazole carboxamide ribotide isomerase
MILFPAIDIKDQKCVRLMQGDFNQSTVYDDNPLSVAQSFERDGASFLHIVDLNGASDDLSSNESIIKTIAQTVNIPIQVGGGIRSLSKVARLLSYGVNRVILGTMAIEDVELLGTLANKFPGQIIVSIDAKHGLIKTRGWKQSTQIKAIDLCKQLEAIGIKTIVYTDISKDGMLSGPNFEDYQMLKVNTNLNIIASGGISSLEDIKQLNEIGLYGAITGKAIYEKRFTVKEAIRCLKNV